MISKKDFVINIGCAAPLVGSYLIIPRGTFGFDFYDNYFIFLIIQIYSLLYLNEKSRIPNWFLKGFIIFIIGSLFALIINNSNGLGFSFWKQIIGVLFNVSSYFLLFKIADFNLLHLFKRYFYFAYLASVFGILTEILFFLGINLTPRFQGALGLYRIGALSGEPYNLSLALFPAVFLILFGFAFKNWDKYLFDKKFGFRSTIIIVAFFLTFSSTGYVGIFLALILLGYHKGFFKLNNPRVLLAPFFILIFYSIFYLLSSNDELFNKKINEGLWFFQEDASISEYKNLNASTFALLSNFEVSTSAFKDNPLFGVGFGNYEMVFHKKFDQIFGSSFEQRYGKSNYNDANSMFLRLLAETGIWGVSIFLYLIISNLIKKNLRLINYNRYEYLLFIIMNHAILILTLIRLLRNGNYLSDGYWFFLLLYFYSHKLWNKLLTHNGLASP